MFKELGVCIRRPANTIRAILILGFETRYRRSRVVGRGRLQPHTHPFSVTASSTAFTKQYIIRSVSQGITKSIAYSVRTQMYVDSSRQLRINHVVRTPLDTAMNTRRVNRGNETTLKKIRTPGFCSSSSSPSPSVLIKKELTYSC